MRECLLFKALVECNDVFLFEVSEHLDLAEGGFLHDVVVVRFFELLYRDCDES